jgi:hypothetical protein
LLATQILHWERILQLTLRIFRKVELEKQKLKNSIAHLNKTNGKELGSYIKKETFFTLADLFKKSNNITAAKKILSEFIETSLDDTKLSNPIIKARSMLGELK